MNKEELFIYKMKALTYNAKCHSRTNLVETNLFFSSSNETVPEELKVESELMEGRFSNLSNEIENKTKSICESYARKEMSFEEFMRKIEAQREETRRSTNNLIDNFYDRIIVIAKKTKKYEIILNVYNRIMLFIEELVESIVNILSNLIRAFVNWVKDLRDGFVNVVRNIGNFFRRLFSMLEVSSTN